MHETVQFAVGKNAQSWYIPVAKPIICHLTCPVGQAHLMNCDAGSDLLGQTVAALAAIAMVFDKVDSNYSSTLETHARSLYT